MLEWRPDDLLAAADAVSSGTRIAGPGGALVDMLRRNGRPPPRLASLLRLAATAERMFLLPAPDAPGMVFVGGQHVVDGIRHNVTGTGVCLEEALRRAVGEIAEGQARGRPGKPLRERRLGDVLQAWPLDARTELARLLSGAVAPDPDSLVPVITGQPMLRVRRVPVPAPLCVRVADVAPPPGWDSGCAAGETIEQATAAALLEVLERDAAMMWWRGGRRARALRLTGKAGERVAAYHRLLRAGAATRDDILIHLTSEFGAAVVAAVSFDRRGRGFACGTAARLDPEEAACAALREMCQMEVGLRLAQLKRSHGSPSAITEGDRRQLLRAERIEREDWQATAISGACGIGELAVPHHANTTIDLLLGNLAARAYHPVLVEFGCGESDFPVARVIVPGLQPADRTFETARLMQSIAANGTGYAMRSGCSLY